MSFEWAEKEDNSGGILSQIVNSKYMEKREKADNLRKIGSNLPKISADELKEVGWQPTKIRHRDTLEKYHNRQALKLLEWSYARAQQFVAHSDAGRLDPIGGVIFRELVKHTISGATQMMRRAKIKGEKLEADRKEPGAVKKIRARILAMKDEIENPSAAELDNIPNVSIEQDDSEPVDSELPGIEGLGDEF